MTREQQAEVWASLDREFLAEIAGSGPPAVFATVSGAHLYGFASPDSDVDLRGAFSRPVHEVLGLRPPPETITVTDQRRHDVDWVAHDLRKFARLLTQHNGYVLEQVFSPLVVVSSPTFEELRELARGCVTRPTVRHYQGFARGRRTRLREPGATVKHLLYAYRVLLSGIHLMRTGDVVANLFVLNELLKSSEVDQLIARKREGAEAMRLAAGELEHHERLLDALEVELELAGDTSALPLEPSTTAALDALVVRTKLASLVSA